MSAGPPRRILLVEDDEDTRQLLAVALESQGIGPGGLTVEKLPPPDRERGGELR